MLAIETILGALTGYFTNDIAIRQLFAKNGVVVRERTQFTEMIVRVLEDQIIDEDVVQSLQEAPEVVLLFERFLRTFVGEELPYIFADCTLADLDKEGVLRQELVARIHALPLDAQQTEAVEWRQQLLSVFNGADFRQSVAEALEHLAACSLLDLDAAKMLEERLTTLCEMEDAVFTAWLDAWQDSVEKTVDAQWRASETRSPRLRELLGVDGTALERLLEQFILDGQATSYARWLDVLKNPALQEHVYILVERLLETLVRQHLPLMVDAFAPLLTEDREDIEKMLLESVAECGESPILCEMMTGLLSKYFSESEDGRDWLTALLEQISYGPEAERHQKALARYLLSGVVQAIDRWRRAAADTPEELAALHQWFLRWRPLAEQGCEMFLALPVHALFSRKTMQTLVKGAFSVMKAQWTPQEERRKMYDAAMQWLRLPLAAHILTPQRQTQLLEMLSSCWRTDGEAWLQSLAPAPETMREAMLAGVDWLFRQPLSCLLCRGQEKFPYARAAALVRKQVFQEMRPFLGKLTREQLNALSHEDMRTLVLDMLGREMRPLAYLGGGIGALAGAATGVAMEMSGVTSDPEAVAALMAVRTGMYGVVGYGTNVAAVYGLFRPYRKTLGFQGLLSKNQMRFAEEMKKMAASYIINDDIWTMQMQAFSQQLDKNFEKLLEDAAAKWMDGQNTFWQEPAKTWIQSQAGPWLYALLKKPRVHERLGAELAASLQHPKLIEWLAGQHPLRQGMDRVAMREAASGTVSHKLLGVLRQIDAPRWTEIINALLEAVHLPEEKAFYDKIWHQILPAYKSLPEWLMSQSDRLAQWGDDKIRSRLSFTMLLGYQMAGGKSLVASVLDVFLNKKLPAYLFRREAAIAETAKHWLQQTFSGQSLTALGVTMAESEGDWLQEMMAALTSTQLQHLLLNLLRSVRTLPAEGETWFVQQTLALLTRTQMPNTDTLLLTQGWAALDWGKVLLRAEPAVKLFAEKMVKESSMDSLLQHMEGISAHWLHSVLKESGVVLHAWRMVAPALSAALVREGRTLVLLVDVPGLIEARIAALPPELLERMVRDIAQPYFTRVERMGWLGAVVAVPAIGLSHMLGGY